MKIEIELSNRPLTAIAAKVALEAVGKHVAEHAQIMTNALLSSGEVTFIIHVEYLGKVKVAIIQ